MPCLTSIENKEGAFAPSLPPAFAVNRYSVAVTRIDASLRAPSCAPNNYLMGGATRSQLGARSPPPLRCRVLLRAPVPCQVLAIACSWQGTYALRWTRHLRFVWLALPLVPTGSNVRSVSLCYALLAPIALSVLSSLPLDFVAITGVVYIGYRLF